MNAADQGIGFLTIGAGTMEIDQNGAYVWSQTVVKNHTETENEDGTYTIQIELNEGLTFSDGTPITAKNYLAKILAFSTPVAVETGHSGMARPMWDLSPSTLTRARRPRVRPRNFPGFACLMSIRSL